METNLEKESLNIQVLNEILSMREQNSNSHVSLQFVFTFLLKLIIFGFWLI